MNWLNKVAQNIFPLSTEQSDVRKALMEWEYQGNFYDLETPSEVCELCEHTDIRYQFEIINRNTNAVLQIGSECVTKFGGISVVDEQGNAVGQREAKQRVARDKHKLIKDAQTKSVINSLILLAMKDKEFSIENFIGYYKERGAFTPLQLATLVWRLEKNDVKFNSIHFKMVMRRDREKEQLRDMEKWRLKKIYSCLSDFQKEFVHKILKSREDK